MFLGVPGKSMASMTKVMGKFPVIRQIKGNDALVI
jgi:hypothetical protein